MNWFTATDSESTCKAASASAPAGSAATSPHTDTGRPAACASATIPAISRNSPGCKGSIWLAVFFEKRWAAAGVLPEPLTDAD